ncbi:perilipin-2 isoform X3 [Strongylocentrotus purpuratus]|uniref:Perilipin n=1 Tax=Strongylocentrotus purpuratus TaxID=7668 RepID=A0A7M7N986_STRPU|nr:perilipin-2 isoform X3 [Strongylocentrotus purpuratus]
MSEAQQPPSMKPEIENQPIGKGQGDECGNEEVNVINRVAALPMVSSTLTQMTNAYNWSKDKNSLVKYTLEMAESTVSMAASTAQPVVNRLGGPISAANDYANQQMDKLEEKVPIITDTPEKMMTDLQDGTKKMIENTKKAGSDRINNLLLTRLGMALTTSVDTALLLSEFAVDYYLPAENNSSNGEKQVPDQALAAAGVEGEDHIPQDKPLEATVQRASRVSNKVRRRVVNKAMRNVRYAQKRSQETLQRLHYTVDLMEYARTNIDSANKAVQSRVESTHQTLSKTWDDWTLEEGDETKGDVKNEVETTNGEQKTLAIARNLAGRLQVLSVNIAGCVRLLPGSLRTKVEEGRELADALYHSLEEAQTIRDLPANVLVTAKQQLDKMSNISLSVADFLVSSTPLQWLVPHQVRQYLDTSSSKLASNGHVAAESTPSSPLGDHSYSKNGTRSQ